MNGKIYMIRNEVNGKRYIGQTVNSLEERFKQHKHGTRQPKKNMTKLQKAMDKYGKPMFTITLIEENIETIELLAEREKFFIEKFNTKEEYNSTSGGENRLRHKKNSNKSESINNLTVVFSNDFNEKIISRLTITEHNLLLGLIGKLQRQGLEEVKLSFREVSSLMKQKDFRSTFLIETLDSLWRKLKKTDYKLYAESKKDLSTPGPVLLLSYLRVDKENSLVRLKLNPDLEYFVNSFKRGSYTSIRLRDFYQIENKYGKLLYKILAQFRSTGYFIVSREDLRYRLDCPKSYDLRKFHTRVLNPAMKSVSEFFPDLKLEKIKSGRKIIRYVFSFRKGENPNHWIKEIEPTNVTPNNDKLTFKTSELQNSNAVNYANTFKNGYIPGENSPTNEFMDWFATTHIYSTYKEYFDVRPSSKKQIRELYKKYVITTESEAWTDMRFFACVTGIVSLDKAMTEWELEGMYSRIRSLDSKDKRRSIRIRIPAPVYKDLHVEQRKQLKEFVNYGKVI